MRIKKVLFILLLPAIAEVIISCCECGEVVSKNYSNQSLSVSNLDNSGAEPTVSFAPSITKDAYGIRFELHRELVAYRIPKRHLFVQSAYATSCECPPEIQFTPKDSVTSLTVYTVYDFDPGHPAGADVSEYFKVYSRFEFTPVEDYFSSLKDYHGNPSQTLYDERQFDLAVDMLLITPPATTHPHKFRVEVSFSDGRITAQETPEIELK